MVSRKERIVFYPDPPFVKLGANSEAATWSGEHVEQELRLLKGHITIPSIQRPGYFMSVASVIYGFGVAVVEPA